jgi:NADH:ubiquinone reductase (H+-translocating)
VEKTGRRVVVIGAGYAGLTAAISIDRRARPSGVRVTLVNPTARFTEKLRLHQSATGQELADRRIPDLLRGTGIELVLGRVVRLDVRARQVTLADGRALPYDTVIYALGATADTGATPGAAAHAYALDGTDQAARIRERLDALGPGAPVVVVGAGLTGVELAAEIAESRPDLGVHLIGREESGASMGGRARAYLHTVLAGLGVRARAGTEVVRVLPDGVELAGGEIVGAALVLWTAGMRAAPLAAESGLPVDEWGRIRVDATLRAVGHPEVFAVGDAAAVTQPYGVLHGTCQSAGPTAAHAADVLVRELTGRRPGPFRFGYVHQPVSLGRRAALVQFTRADETPRRLVLTGRPAVAYQELVTSGAWSGYRVLRHWPGGLRWPRGGRLTRNPGGAGAGSPRRHAAPTPDGRFAETTHRPS